MSKQKSTGNKNYSGFFEYYFRRKPTPDYLFFDQKRSTMCLRNLEIFGLATKFSFAPFESVERF